MSSGAFSRSKYEADDGTIFAIRVQPETLLANLGSPNAAPAGAVTGTGSARARGSKRKIGVNARTVRLAFTGALPDGYAPNTVLSIPVLTKAVYDAIKPNGTTGTYLGNPVIVIGKTAESIR